MVNQHYLTCSKCNKSKSRSEFTKNKAMKSGYSNWCKSCFKLSRDSKAKVTIEEAKKFYQSVIDSGKEFQCSSCNKVATADHFYYQRDNGSVKISSSNCRECNAFSQKLKNYGISKEMFEQMLLDQDNSCAICGIDHEEYRLSAKGKRFSIDHCHSTGKVRGLLCEWCNKGLGHFKDNISNMEKAVDYLKR